MYTYFDRVLEPPAKGEIMESGPRSRSGTGVMGTINFKERDHGLEIPFVINVGGGTLQVKTCTEILCKYRSV